MEEATKKLNVDIGTFAGLGDLFTFISLKDPTEFSPGGYHEKGSVPIFTRRGKFLLKPEKFMDIVESFKPDCYVALSDSDTTDESSTKRITKSVERTEEFVGVCVERHQKSEILKGSMLIGPIVGGYSLPYRENSIKNILKHSENIGGFIYEGLHPNGSEAFDLEWDEVKKVIVHCQERLPVEKMKLMLGAYDPIVVLELVKLGVDVFDSSFPYIQAINNIAITFNFDVNQQDVTGPYSMDLSCKSNKEDFTPFMANCLCLACQKHTKAYTHHLIDTKELLAPILLMMYVRLNEFKVFLCPNDRRLTVFFLLLLLFLVTTYIITLNSLKQYEIVSVMISYLI